MAQASRGGAFSRVDNDQLGVTRDALAYVERAFVAVRVAIRAAHRRVLHRAHLRTSCSFVRTGALVNDAQARVWLGALGHAELAGVAVRLTVRRAHGLVDHRTHAMAQRRVLHRRRSGGHGGGGSSAWAHVKQLQRTIAALRHTKHAAVGVRLTVAATHGTVVARTSNAVAVAWWLVAMKTSSCSSRECGRAVGREDGSVVVDGDGCGDRRREACHGDGENDDLEHG